MQNALDNLSAGAVRWQKMPQQRSGIADKCSEHTKTQGHGANYEHQQNKRCPTAGSLEQRSEHSDNAG